MKPHSTESATITEELLESIYVVSKNAKKESALATEKYNANRKREAKRHSDRKEALYNTKRLSLQQLQTEADRIMLDEIESELYYCLYFYYNQSEWVFHTPKQLFHLHPDKTVQNTSKNTLTNFSSTTTIPADYNTLKQSLLYINKKLQINANAQLPSSQHCIDSSWYFL